MAAPSGEYAVLKQQQGHGLVYENKGEKITSNPDGSTTISHNMYNAGPGYGVAEVRDKNGNLVDQIVISPNKMAVGASEVMGEMKDSMTTMFDGLASGDPRAATHSEKSTLQYTVPEGGSVTFTKGSNLAGTLNTLGAVFDLAGVAADANSMEKLAAKLLVMGVGMKTMEDIQKGGVSKLKEVIGLIKDAAKEAGLSAGIDMAFDKVLSSTAGLLAIVEVTRQGLAIGGNAHFAAKEWEKARKMGSDSYLVGPRGLLNSKWVAPGLQSLQTGQPNPNPNIGLNQTAANNAQNKVRTTDAKRSSSSGDGSHVRMHAHPWTVISPPGFGNHPDDVLDDANAASPVPAPAYHANVLQTGSSSYNQWGTWEDGPASPAPPGYVTTAGTGPAYWIAGRITPAHGVPTSGTATYSGTLEGTMHTHVFATSDRHTPVPVTGGFSLNASFAARTLDGTFSFSPTSGFLPGTSLTAAGSWAPGSSQHFGDLTGPGVYDGKFNGYFFGGAAEGIGGVWNAKTTTGAPAGSEFKAYGTYNGTRGPVTP